MGKITDLGRWRAEIELAERFREEEFGKYEKNEKVLAGENIDYFEKGFSDRLQLDTEDTYLTTLNIIDTIVSVVVPSLYFKNPRTMCLPQKIESEDSALIAGKTIDYYKRKLEADEINQRIIWDAYVLGFGVSKTGYATKFGKDIEDSTKKEKSVLDKTLEFVGLKKKEAKEIIQPEVDQRIIAESPFIEWVSPFCFLLDPRAKSINDAMWCGHSMRKNVNDLKRNKKYKNTSKLEGSEIDIEGFNLAYVAQSEIESFRLIDLYEIEYRNEGKYYTLVLVKDNGNEWQELYHEESIYDLNEFQFDVLTFKKHNHRQYPRSDITKIKNLQDRITNTIDAILEQVDRFTPKLAYETGALTKEGKNNLENGDIGAIVECNKSPLDVFKELNFTQLKTDLANLLDQLITLITMQTGLTRAMLTGMSNSGSATEATIEQSGQTLRMSDMQVSVQRFVNRQSRKLWKVIKQFVDLEDLQLINGVKGIDETTGAVKYDWLLVPPSKAEELITGEFDFDIEVGSTQKADLSVIRKAFENMFNILARTEVIALMQQQGDKVVLAEMLRRYLDLFPEMGIDGGKIIQKITQGTTGLIPPPVPEQGGMTSGSTDNAMKSMMAEQAPTQGGEINRTF